VPGALSIVFIWSIKLMTKKISAAQIKKTKTLRKICFSLGLENGGFSWDRGDSFSLEIIAIAYTPAQLRKHHATGSILGVVAQYRKRVYARSSKFKTSYRTDFFLVGKNENGNPFMHQVPGALSVAYALEWIWKGAKIEERHGDIGIALCNLKNAEGESVDMDIPGTGGSHRIFGEIREKGGLYARNAFIYHRKEQHPSLYIGSEWRRVVVGRRSAKGMSSAD
jgi:hypothetical protein